MYDVSNETIIDPYKNYMTRTPEFELSSYVLLDELSSSSLKRFADNDGSFSKSFDVAIRGNAELADWFIISSVAHYETQGEQIPAVQMRIIDDNADTLYYSPVYEIGHSREFYRREWRVMPTFDRYNILRLSFIIPEGVRLFIKNIGIKKNYGFIERNIGIRYHGHGGNANAFGMQLTAEAGFTTCITIPKFTKDNVAVCMHDDATIIHELSFDDGTKAIEGGPYDKPISEFTYAELMQFSTAWRKRSDVFAGTRIPTMDEYFYICSMTGMQPVFSVHPELTKEQWYHVRELLIKYRLLEHFWVKSGRVNVQKLCNEVFGTEIAGRIILQRSCDDWDPAQRVREMELDPKANNVVIEYFNLRATEKRIKTAREEGFHVSVAAMSGGNSGPYIRKLIDLGVSEFTLDHHCSMGLSW